MARKNSKTRCTECNELETALPETKEGKRAVSSAHKALIGGQFDCSVNVESALGDEQREGERIYDYLLIAKNECTPTFVEVHPASSTHEVDVVLKKKRDTEAIAARAGLKRMVGRAQWHGVATSGRIVVGGGRTDIKSRQLAESGIKLSRKVGS